MKSHLLPLCATLLIVGCTTPLSLLPSPSVATTEEVSIAIPFDNVIPENLASYSENEDYIEDAPVPDGEPIIMKAVQNENGEMVVVDQIKAATVSTPFRNIAERDGKVELTFDVRVPQSIQGRQFQLRLTPMMYLGRDSVKLEDVLVTGDRYRKAQLRGYERYRRYVESIVTDTTRFINLSQLEVFLRRNLPQVYAFRSDTSLVTDLQFRSAFGVGGQEAVDHYTYWTRVRRNKRRIQNLDKVFARMVKSPLLSEGLRLDSVIVPPGGDFIYRYTQSLNAFTGLRKVDIRLFGGVYEQDREIRKIPHSSPLTFYISSLSTLADNNERYLRSIVGRHVEVNTACYIDFASGDDKIDLSLANNRDEIGRIRDNFREIIRRDEFSLDSVVVTASCSPEGTYRFNSGLSERRSRSVARYFEGFIGDWSESGTLPPGVKLVSRSDPENWALLDSMVEKDGTLSEEDKVDYRFIRAIQDPDKREGALAKEPFYRYLRESVYPRLRTVKFDFHLHRLGMEKDTVTTTEIDRTYHDGLMALRERDYSRAVSLLGPYKDYNAALAYAAQNYNASAMSILASLEKDAKVEYLMAILCSREGDTSSAKEHYRKACLMDRSYLNRGNLDPEIHSLGTIPSLQEELLGSL